MDCSQRICSEIHLFGLLKVKSYSCLSLTAWWCALVVLLVWGIAETRSCCGRTWYTIPTKQTTSTKYPLLHGCFMIAWKAYLYFLYLVCIFLYSNCIQHTHMHMCTHTHTHTTAFELNNQVVSPHLLKAFLP